MCLGPKGLDTPKTVALFLSCFCLKFYRLPTTRCENDKIRHAFLSSFTIYRHKKNGTVLVCQDPEGLDTPKIAASFLHAFL